MRKFTALLALLLLAGCSETQRIDRPIGDVRTTLVSLPQQSNAMDFSQVYRETDTILEDQGNRLIWHFRRNGLDYARYTVELEADGDSATNITSNFETADDASDADQLGFLRNLARKAAEASVAAALAGRAVNQAEFQQILQQEAVNNPTSFAKTSMKSASDAMDRAVQQQKDEEYYDSPVLPEAGVLPEPGVTPKRGGEGQRRE